MPVLRRRGRGLPPLASSENLHPTHGARFVLLREDDAGSAYAVTVYLANKSTLTSTLRFADGKASCDPPFDDARVQDETLKLARVLKRTPKPRLTRWRDL